MFDYIIFSHSCGGISKSKRIKQIPLNSRNHLPLIGDYSLNHPFVPCDGPDIVVHQKKVPLGLMLCIPLVAALTALVAVPAVSIIVGTSAFSILFSAFCAVLAVLRRFDIFR
jgi:hypothetical protein